MKRYTTALGNVSHTARGARGVADIVAALAPPAKPASGSESGAMVRQEEPKESLGQTVYRVGPGVAGAVAGAVLWKKHRVLGLLAGHAMGASVLPLVRGDDRTRAVTQLGVEAAGIGGALLAPVLLKSKSTVVVPVLGWVTGLLLGAVATSYVPGSAVRQEYEKLKAERKK